MEFSALFAVALGAAIILRSNARKLPSGGGGRGGESAKDKLRPFFLWTALIMFAFAGTLAPTTFVGDMIGAVAGMAIWLAWLLFIGMFAAVARDLWHDHEPDKAAPFALFLLPSISTELGGAIGQSIRTMWAAYGDVVGGAFSQLTGL